MTRKEILRLRLRKSGSSVQGKTQLFQASTSTPGFDAGRY